MSAKKAAPAVGMQSITSFFGKLGSTPKKPAAGEFVHTQLAFSCKDVPIGLTGRALRSCSCWVASEFSGEAECVLWSAVLMLACCKRL